MTGEVDLFRAELRAAGQPWSRWGVVGSGLGMLLLVAAQVIGQIAPFAAWFFPVLGVSLILLAAGWVSLLAAFLKRRRWARAHPLVMPGLSEPGGGAIETR